MSYEDQVSAVASMWSGLRNNCKLTDADGREGLIHAIYTHTVSLVIQFQWSSWKPEQRNILERPMFSSLDGKYEIFNAELEERDQNWERLLKKTITAIRDIADKPWTNASITQLVKKELPQSYEECTKLKLWLLCEGGCAYLYRIYELAKQKQRGMLCNLIGNTRRLLGISDDARESSLDSRVKKAGFDQNVLDVMTDMEMIAMNYSVDSFCIDKAKAMELSDGLNVVQRLRKRLDSVTKDFPMWKDCKHIIKTCSQMFVARLLTAPFTSELHTLLYQFCVELIKSTRRKDLSKDISKIMALACSAQHLHVCSLAARDVLSNNLPFVVENYVRTLTAATNELEEFRSDKKEDDMKNHSTMFSSWLLELAEILKENKRVTAECILTAFSLTPDQKMYDLVQRHQHCAVSEDIKSEDPWSESEPSTSTGWSRDSHSRNTFLVKTSERLWGSERPSASLRASIVSVEVLEGLGLNPDLCQDFIVLLSGPRVKTLSWDMKWEVLEKNCQLHIDKTNSGPTINKELTSVLNSLYLHEPGPSGSDDEDICSGIEKGYEPVYEPAVVNRQPEPFRNKFMDDYLEDFEDEDAPSKEELAEVSWLPASMRQKIKKRHRKKPGKVPITIKIKSKKHNTRSKKIKKKTTKSGDKNNIHSSDEDISLAYIKTDNGDKMDNISLEKILDSTTPPTSNIIYDSFAETCPDLDNFDNVIFENPKMEPKLENTQTKVKKETNNMVSDAKSKNVVNVNKCISIMAPLKKLPNSVNTPTTQLRQAGPLSSSSTKLSSAPTIGEGTKIQRVANVTTSSAELSKNINPSLRPSTDRDCNIHSSTASISPNSNQNTQGSTSKLIHFRKPNVNKKTSNATAKKTGGLSLNKTHFSQDHMTEHEKNILSRLFNRNSLQITRKGESNLIVNNFTSNDRSVLEIRTKRKYVRNKNDKKPINSEIKPKCPKNIKPETNVIGETIEKKQSYPEPVANTPPNKTFDVNSMGIWDIGCALLKDISRFGRACTANELLLTYAYSENFIDTDFDKFWLTEIDWIVKQILLSFRHEDVNFINQGVVLFDQILGDNFKTDTTGEIADEIRRKCRIKIKNNKVLHSLLNVFRRRGIIPLRREYCQSNAANLSEACENNFGTNSAEKKIQFVREQAVGIPMSANSNVTKNCSTSLKISSPKIIIDGRINIPKNSVTTSSHLDDIQANNTLQIQSQSSIRRLANQTPLNSSFVCENVVKTSQSSPWEPSILKVEKTKKKHVPNHRSLMNQQLVPLPAFSSLVSGLKSGSQNNYNSVAYEHISLGHPKNMDSSSLDSLPNFQIMTNVPSTRDTSYTNVSKDAVSRATLLSEISLHPVSQNLNNNLDITKQNYIESKNAISPSLNTCSASQEHSLVKMLLQRKIVMGQKYQKTFNDSVENLSQKRSELSHESIKNEQAQFQTDKKQHVHTKQVIQVVSSTNNRTPMLQIRSIRDDKISNTEFDNTCYDLSKTRTNSQPENDSNVQSYNKCQFENELNTFDRSSVITGPILSQATKNQDVHSRNQKLPKGLIKPTGILKVTGKNASGFYVVSSTNVTELKSSGSETCGQIDETVYSPSDSIRVGTKDNAQIRADNLMYEARTNISVDKILSGTKMGSYMPQNIAQHELSKTELDKCAERTVMNNRISMDTNVSTMNKFSRTYACKKNRIISIDYPSDCSPEKVCTVDNVGNFQKQTHKRKVIDQKKKISVLEDVPITINKVLNKFSKSTVSGNCFPESCTNNLKHEQINFNKEDETSKHVQHVLNNLPFITINKLSHKNYQPAEINVEPVLPASGSVNNKTSMKINLSTPINNEASEMLIGRKISYCNVSSIRVNNVTDIDRTQDQLNFEDESSVDKSNERIKLITPQSGHQNIISKEDIPTNKNIAQFLNSNDLINKVTKLPEVTIVPKSLFLQNANKIEQNFDQEAQKLDKNTSSVEKTSPTTVIGAKAKIPEKNYMEQKKKLKECLKQQQDAKTIMAGLFIPGLSVRKVSISKSNQPNSAKITENEIITQDCVSQEKKNCNLQESSLRSRKCDAHQMKQQFDEDNAYKINMSRKQFLPGKDITIGENVYKSDKYKKNILSDKEVRTNEKPKDVLILDREKLNSLTIQPKIPVSPNAMLKRQKIKRRITDCVITSAKVISLPWYQNDEVSSNYISTSDKYSHDSSWTPIKLIKGDTLSATGDEALKHFDSNIPKKIEMESPSKNKQFIGKRPGPKSKTMLEKSTATENSSIKCVKYELQNKSTECEKQLQHNSDILIKYEMQCQSNSDESNRHEVGFQISPEKNIKQEIKIQNISEETPKQEMEFKIDCDESIEQDIVLESNSDISPKPEMKLQISSKESPNEKIQFSNIYDSENLIETVQDITITNNPNKFRYITTQDISYNEDLNDGKKPDIESILENHIISREISTPLNDDTELRNEVNLPDKIDDILDLEQFVDSIRETISENTIIIKEVSTDTSMEDVLAVTDNESENDFASDIDENMSDIESILENHVIVRSNTPRVDSNIQEDFIVSEVDLQNDSKSETMDDKDDLNHDCDIVTIIEVEETPVPTTNNTNIIPVNKEIFDKILETETEDSENVKLLRFRNDLISDMEEIDIDKELLLISTAPTTSDNLTVVELHDDIKSDSSQGISEIKINIKSCENYKEVLRKNTEKILPKSDENVEDDTTTANNIIDVKLNVSDTSTIFTKYTISDKLIDNDTELKNVCKSETTVQNIENTYLSHSVPQTDSDVHDKPTARDKENISEIQRHITDTNLVGNSTTLKITDALTGLKSIKTIVVNETESENEMKSDTTEEIDDIVKKISDIDIILDNKHSRPVSNIEDIFATKENTENTVLTPDNDPETLNKTLSQIEKLNSPISVKDVDQQQHNQSSPEILNNTNNSTSEIIENKEWSQNSKPVEKIKGKENVLESNISSTPIVTGTHRRKQKSHIVAKANKKQKKNEIVQKRITRNSVQKSKLKSADKKKPIKKSLKEIRVKSENNKTKDINKSLKEKLLKCHHIKPEIEKSLVEKVIISRETASVNSVPKKFHVEFPTAPPKTYFKVPLTKNVHTRIINDDESRILLAHMNEVEEIDRDVQEVVLEDPLNIEEEENLKEQERDSKSNLCAIKEKDIADNFNKEHPIGLTFGDEETYKTSLKDKLSFVYSFPHNYACCVKLNTKDKKKFNELIYPSLRNQICTPKFHRLSKAVMNKYMKKVETESGETWATRKSLRNIAEKKNTKRIDKHTTIINSIKKPCDKTEENQQKNRKKMPQKTSEAIINPATEETPSMVPNKKFITNLSNIAPLKTVELSTVEEIVVSDSDSDETSEPVVNCSNFKKTSHFKPLLTRAQVKLIEALADPKMKFKFYKRFSAVNSKKLNITSQLTEEVICLSSDDESEKSEAQNVSNVIVKTFDSMKEVGLEQTAAPIMTVVPKMSVDLNKADSELEVHSKNIADEMRVIVDFEMDDLKIIAPTKTIDKVISNELVDLKIKAVTMKTVDSNDKLYSKKIDDTLMTVNSNIDNLKKTIGLKTEYNTIKSHDSKILKSINTFEAREEADTTKLQESKGNLKDTNDSKRTVQSQNTTETVIMVCDKNVDSKTVDSIAEANEMMKVESKYKTSSLKKADSKKTVILNNVMTTDPNLINLKKTVELKADSQIMKLPNSKIVDSKKTVNWKKSLDIENTTNSLITTDFENDDLKLMDDLKMADSKKTVDFEMEADIIKTRDSKLLNFENYVENTSDTVLAVKLDLLEIDISDRIVGSVINQKQKTTSSKNLYIENEICIELRNSNNLNNSVDTEPKQTFYNILESNITVLESAQETERERIQISHLNVIAKPPHRGKRKSFNTDDEKNKRICVDEISNLNKCNRNQSRFFKTYSKKQSTSDKTVDSWLKSNITLTDHLDILSLEKVVNGKENIQVEIEKDKEVIESDPDSLYTDLGNELEDASRDSYLNIILPDNPLVGAVSIYDTLCWDSTESDYSQDLITIPCNDQKKFEYNDNTSENPDTAVSEDDKSLCSFESEELFTGNTSNKLFVTVENKILHSRNSPIILDDSINNNCEIQFSVPKKPDYANELIVAGQSTQQPRTNNNQKESVLAKVKERTIGHKQPSQSNQDDNETKSKVTKKGFGNVSDRVYVTSGITESLFGISAAALSDIKPQPLRSSKDKENNLNATNIQVDSLKYRKEKKNNKSKGVKMYLRPSLHLIDEFDIFKKYTDRQENNIFERNILSNVLGLNNYNLFVPAKQTYMVQVVEVRQFHSYNGNQNSLTSSNDIQTQQNENSPHSEDARSNAPETPVSEISEKNENVSDDSTEGKNTVKKTVISMPEDITPPQSTGSKTFLSQHDDQEISQNCSNIDCNADIGDTKLIVKNLKMTVNNYGTKKNIQMARSKIAETVKISSAKVDVESTFFALQKVNSEIAEEDSQMKSIQNKNKIVEHIEKTEVNKNNDTNGNNFLQKTSQVTQSVTKIDIEKSSKETAEEHSKNQSYGAAEETIQIEDTATAGHNIECLVTDEFLDIDNTQITEDAVDQVSSKNCQMMEENIEISDVDSTEAANTIQMDEDPMMNIETNMEDNCLITDSEVVEDDVQMLDTEITEDDYELSNIPEDDIEIDSQMIEDEFQMWDAQHNIPMANSEVDVDSTPMVDFTVPCAVISRASPLGTESQRSEPYDKDVNYRISDAENVKILESPLNEFLSFGTREREVQTIDVAYIDALNSEITELNSEVQDTDADKNIESEDTPFDYNTYPTISEANVPAIQSLGTEPQVQFVLTSARPKPVLVTDALNLTTSMKNKDFHSNSTESNGCQAAAVNEKPTIKNAMLLQQALAQILPPLQNQSSGFTSHQNNIAQPLFRFIQQGRSTPVTLVDKGQQSTSNTTPQFLHVVQNKLSGNQNAAISLADSNFQHGNQVIHIVNSGNQAKVASATQLFKRVNLLTSLTNTQVGKEQKMVQFVCKSADGKSIHLNSPHRGMVFRLQPVDAVKTQTPVIQAPPFIPDPPTDVAQNLENKAPETEQELRSRSTYEENYAKFIRRATSKARKAQVAKARGLPKFNQAFGKATFQDNANENKSETEDETEQANVEPIVIVNNIQQAPQDGESNPNLAARLAGPPLLIRKSPQTVVQQIKQAISPAQPLQTLQGGVIYTRQIPMNLSPGKTINLITVPNSDDTQKQDTKNRNTNNVSDSPIIQIIKPSNACGNIEMKSESQPTGNDPNLTQVHPVVTQMRIRLPMLSKTPQMIGNARLLRPYLQIQKNVIAGQNQPVYQQLVLTTAAPQHGITTPPQSASAIPIQRAEPNISSSTLEQLREFDMVFEQVKERSTLGDTSIDTPQSEQSLIIAEPSLQSNNLYQHSQVVTTVVNKKIVKRTISRPMVTCSQSPPAGKYTESSSVTTYEETQSTTYAETEAVTNYEQVKARENWESETIETNEESETITTLVESEPMRFVEAPPLNGYEEPEPLTYQELQPVNYDDSISQPMQSYSESDSIRTFDNSQSTYVEPLTDSFSEPLHVNTYQGSPLLSYSDTQQTSYTESQPTSTHSDSNDKSSEFSLVRKFSKKKKKKTPNTTCMVGKTVPALSPTKLIPTIVAPAHRHPPMTKPPPLPKPQEDDETTQRILYILAEYKDQLENCPDKDRPAPRRRNLALPVVPGERKRKKIKKTTLQNVDSPSDDPNRTIGSEDSSCGTSQADYSENNQGIDMPSPLGSPSKASRRYSFQQDSEASTSGHQKSTNTEGPMMQSPAKATTAVLMPGNYLLPVSMMKGGQQITIVTNQGQKILTLPQGDGASNALFLQRLVGAATLKTVQGKPTQILRPVQIPVPNTINTQPMNLSSNVSNPSLSANVNNTPCNVSPKIFMDTPTSDIESCDMPLMKDDTPIQSDNEPSTDTVRTGNTGQTNMTEPLTKKAKIKPKKPSTVNLIHLHSLGSTEGSPTKVFSVGNPAQLGSILQLASCKSSGTALKSAKLPDLGQSVMILRKHESTDQFVLETNDSSGNQEVKILPGLVARCGSGAIIAMKQQGKVDGKIYSGENLQTGLEGQSSWRFMAASNVNSTSSTSTTPAGVTSLGATSQGSKMKFVTHNIISSATLKDQQTAAALVNLKNKYNVMDKDVRFQKSLTEDCEDIDLNVPSTSNLFPDTDMIFSPTPSELNSKTRNVTNGASTNKQNHGQAVLHTGAQKDLIKKQVSTEPNSFFHTASMVLPERCIITQDTPVILQDPSMDSGEGIVLRDSAMVLREPTMVLKESPVVLRESMVSKETPVLFRNPSIILREPTMVLRNEKGEPVDPFSDEGLGLMAVAAEMKGGRIVIDEEEFAREHPNTTFHSEELAEEAMVQPFPIVPRGPQTDNSTFHDALSKPVTLSTDANEQITEYNDTETRNPKDIYRDEIEIQESNPGEVCVKSSKKFKPCVRKTAVKSSTFKVSENHLKKIIDTGFAVDLNVCKNEDRLKQLVDDSFGPRQTEQSSPSNFKPDSFWESNIKMVDFRMKDDDPIEIPDAFDSLINKPSTSVAKKPKPVNKMQLRTNSVIKSPKKIISHPNKAINVADSSTPDVSTSVNETKKPPMRTYPSKRAVNARKQAEIVQQDTFATNNVDGLLNTIATSILCGLRDCGTTSSLMRTEDKINAQTVPQKFNSSEITITKTGVKRFNLNGTVQIPKKKVRVRKPVTSTVRSVSMTDSVHLDTETFVSK